MKREEEIYQAMKESVCETIYSSGYGFTPQATDLLGCAFTKGAEWADKTMLDRACEWLGNRHNIEKYLGVLTSRTEDLSKAFRKAMEE